MEITEEPEENTSNNDRSQSFYENLHRNALVPILPYHSNQKVLQGKEIHFNPDGRITPERQRMMQTLALVRNGSHQNVKEEASVLIQTKPFGVNFILVGQDRNGSHQNVKE